METLKTVEDLLHLSPIKFQEMTMSLYKALGCEVHPLRIPGRHHLYVDILTKENKKSLAECRIGLEDVDKDVVESFALLLKREKAVEGAIITFGEVTDKARQAGKKKRIYLYDGSDFLGLWNNLHLSDTSPREAGPGEAAVFTQEPPAVHEVDKPSTPTPVAVPAWAAQPDAEPENSQAQVSFLDQIQSDNQKDQKSSHTRDEIHRLFESKPPVIGFSETAEPVIEKSSFDQPDLAETAPTGQEIGPAEISPVEPQAPFMQESQVEPQSETLADYLRDEPEPLPPVQTLEPQPVEGEGIPEDEIVPSAQSSADLVQKYFSLEVEAEPADQEPLPIIEEPAPLVEPLPEVKETESESENVIQRLFGRGVEPASSNKTSLEPVEEEMVDFSIFQIPETKPKDAAPTEEPANDQALDDSTPLPEQPVAASLPVQPEIEVPPVSEDKGLEEPPVPGTLPAQAEMEEQPALTTDQLSQTPVVEPIPPQSLTNEALIETAPLNPETARLAFKNSELQEIGTPASATEASAAGEAQTEAGSEAAPLEGQFLEGFFALSEDSSNPENPVEAIALPQEPAQSGLPENAEASLPDAAATIPEVPPPPTGQAITEIPAKVDENQPVESSPSLNVPTELSESIQEIEPVVEPASPVEEPLIVILHPDQAARGTAKSPDPDNAAISKAVERMEADSACVFITGRPGTGKNILLDYFADSTSKNMVLLAPTAGGALELGGQTLRSFFNFQEYPVQVDDIQEISDPAQKEIFRHIDSMIIDEISKVGPNVIDAIDRFMRLNGRDAEKAFGGVQMVFFGDLFQASYNRSANGMAEEYRSPFFFDAHVFKQLPIEVIELQKEYDRRDETMAALLNAIRTNALDDAQYKALAERVDPDFALPSEPSYITLTSNSGVATRINREQLKQLRSPECLHVAEIEGEFEESAYPVDRELILRRGAQVVFLKEDYAKKWSKGTLGKVTNISESTIQVEVDADGFPFVFRVERETWQNYRYKFNPANGRIEKEVAGEFTQYPLCPGWAMTVQKSQGSRFDNVVIDLSGEEAEYGQLYPALCSCRRLDGIVLKDRISQKYKANAVNRIQEIASLFYQ